MKNIQAFPRPVGSYGPLTDLHFNDPQKGMTLRQYYKGQAIAGILANETLVDMAGDRVAMWAAQFSAEIADAMLLEDDSQD